MERTVYILIDDRGTDLYTEEYTSPEEALKDAEMQWDHLTDREKANCEAFYLIKSENPDEEAENHLDGDLVKSWK